MKKETLENKTKSNQLWRSSKGEDLCSERENKNVTNQWGMGAGEGAGNKSESYTHPDISVLHRYSLQSMKDARVSNELLFAFSVDM